MDYYKEQGYYEYTLIFSDGAGGLSDLRMANDTWYNMKITCGDSIGSTSPTDKIMLKLGMATYSGLSKTKAVVYDRNYDLANIYLTSNTDSTMSISTQDKNEFNTSPTKTNSKHTLCH